MTDRYDRIFKNLLGYDEEELRVLQSIRFRDQDQSTKGAALLAFAGLLIATSLVQLSAEPTAAVSLDKKSVALILSFLGLFFLFISSLFSLASLVSSGKYSDNSRVALLQFYDLVQRRGRKIGVSYFFCMIGTLFVLATLFLSMYPDMHRWVSAALN